MDIINWIAFGIVSLGLIVISWRTLFKPRSHGFYRFISWELILLLFIFNYKYWFENPFCATQIFSWIFLVISGIFVVLGVIQIRKSGNSKRTREGKDLYQFEKTTKLVDTGIYKFIRHPLYSSLLFLAWGIYMKNPSLIMLAIVIACSIFLYLTAIFDEKECLEYFGEEYQEYIRKTKMFIPFVY